MAPVAPSTARGTVRAGSRISPLGVSALSTPPKAKKSSSVPAPSCSNVGQPDQARFDRWTANDPDRHEQQERQQLRHGGCHRDPLALAHAADVDGGEPAEEEHEGDDACHPSGKGGERQWPGHPS